MVSCCGGRLPWCAAVGGRCEARLLLLRHRVEQRDPHHRHLRGQVDEQRPRRPLRVHDRRRVAKLCQVPRRHEAVAAVVARTAHAEHPLVRGGRILLQYRRRHREAGQLHQLVDREAGRDHEVLIKLGSLLLAEQLHLVHRRSRGARKAHRAAREQQQGHGAQQACAEHAAQQRASSSLGFGTAGRAVYLLPKDYTQGVQRLS